jgi:hypothetical protein
MTALILILVILNIIAGDFSITGERMRMSAHPVFVRIRYLGFGMVAALIAAGHSLLSNDWLSWVAVLLLAVGVARFPYKRRELRNGEPANNVTAATGQPASRLSGG